MFQVLITNDHNMYYVDIMKFGIQIIDTYEASSLEEAFDFINEEFNEDLFKEDF